MEADEKTKPKQDKQHPPGASQTVSLLQRDSHEFVFVHRARLGGKTSVVIFTAGLLVLKEQIPVRRQVVDLLQSMTLTMEWIA